VTIALWRSGIMFGSDPRLGAGSLKAWVAKEHHEATRWTSNDPRRRARLGRAEAAAITTIRKRGWHTIVKPLGPLSR
jgi:hypothetical protein